MNSIFIFSSDFSWEDDLRDRITNYTILNIDREKVPVTQYCDDIILIGSQSSFSFYLCSKRILLLGSNFSLEFQRNISKMSNFTHLIPFTEVEPLLRIPSREDKRKTYHVKFATTKYKTIVYPFDQGSLPRSGDFFDNETNIFVVETTRIYLSCLPMIDDYIRHHESHSDLEFIEAKGDNRVAIDLILFSEKNSKV